MKCEHVECGNIDKVWLQHMVGGNIKGLKPHPFCIRCGMVKNIGSDKARSIGYYMNVLASMGKQLRTPGANVRMRLIAKELEQLDDFDDAYSMNRYNQERIFTDLVKKYFQIPDGVVQLFL